MASIYKSDIEDDEDLLGEVPGEPIEFWENKQRELLTSVVDYNLSTLTDLVSDNSIDVSPRYQRRLRWDEKRQSRLIESFLMNVPVPPIYLNEDSYGSYSVIDGKQRLSAITDFLRGRLRLEGLEVFSDINGLTIDDIPAKLKSVIKTRPTLRAIIILRQSDDDVKFEVFQRLNTGGVKLNAQEIRNSAWPGPLNNLILDLSEIPEFHSLLGIRNKKRSKIYQEMRDAEFVLRYFTFKDTWQSFSGGMKRHMDGFMLENQKKESDFCESLSRDFLDAIRKVEAAFGEHAFRRWDPKRQSWRKQVLAALYDAQMFACQSFDFDHLRSGSHAFTRRLQEKFSDSEFRKVIDSATNTPSYFKERINLMRELLQ